MSNPSFNWQLKETTDASAMGQIVKTALTQTSQQFCGSFFEASAAPDRIVSFSTGYTLWWDTTHQLNEIHRVALSGGGEIYSAHGPLPILFFAKLQQCLREMSGEKSSLMRFCTEDGDIVKLETWKDISTELIRLGFDDQILDVSYDNAMKVGLILRLFDESRMEETEFGYF